MASAERHDKRLHFENLVPNEDEATKPTQTALRGISDTKPADDVGVVIRAGFII